MRPSATPVAAAIPLAGRFCLVCRSESPEFKPGPGGRPDARCPCCQSLERHRLLAVLLRLFSREVGDASYLLEVAPTPAVAAMLKARTSGRYVGTDIDPTADGRSVDVVADLCLAPFAESTFDIVVCFHVFEHIPDDATAMSELARILTPSGIAFVQVPWRPTGTTEEDPDALPEERVRRFGQADHVRIYGSDFEDRMRKAGLNPVRTPASSFMGAELMEILGLVDRSPVWIVSRADGVVVDRHEALVPSLRGRLEALALEGWRRAEADADARAAAEARAIRAEAAYRRLRSRWPIRVAVTVRNQVRRLVLDRVGARHQSNRDDERGWGRS